MNDTINQVATGGWPDGEPTLCEQEQIHLPGAIQRHGALLATRADDLRVTHASANLADILGTPAQAALGQNLAAILGEPATQELRQAGSGNPHDRRRTYLLTVPDGGTLHLDAHRSGQHICIDIEPCEELSPQSRMIGLAQSVLDSFKTATSPGALCDLAVRQLRAITGYDRVIVYRFFPDGHGEVVAEDCAAGVEALLGICYPASDVPSQVRRHYLAQPVGMVGDARSIPVPLLTDQALEDGMALDLTHSTLRSVSPVHRQYMLNMKTLASLTIGLAVEQNLWGMLVCHHREPRVAGPDLRAVAGIAGQVVALLLASLGQAELIARMAARRVALRALVDRFAVTVPLADTLARSETELLQVVDAAGALVVCGGAVHRLGRTPPIEMAERALVTLQLANGGIMTAVDDLGQRFPALADCVADGSGALMLPLTQGTADAILWFRPEQSRTVRWGGNSGEHGTIGPLPDRPSPRTSFAVWKETVRGRAAPWEPIDLAIASELREAIDIDAGNRIRLELAALRHAQNLSEVPFAQRTAELEEFAYAASHDLKAPLRAIEHLAQWIGEDLASTAPPDTVENLRLLKGRVRRLQFLLNGLLAYSRVGRQADTASFESVDVAALVNDIVTQLAVPAGFTVACDANLPILRTDRIQIQVVLTNLIGNAIKHHDRTEGHVDVTMRLNDGVAEFRVADDGPGIPPKFHERIFVVFQTLASRDEVEGSGIGLAIVKKMVLSNGGTIKVESAPPARGSTFVFTWKEAST